jgi:hypothetical protein
MVIRNTMFRLRRNAWLYVWLGISLCSLIVAAFSLVALALYVAYEDPFWLVAIAVYLITALFLMYSLYSRILADPFQIFFSVLNTNAWNRFHSAALGKSIVDQIHRDKSNIVHFRDRFGMGG